MALSPYPLPLCYECGRHLVTGPPDIHCQYCGSRLIGLGVRPPDVVDYRETPPD